MSRDDLLEQYRELCAGWRHDDKEFSQFTRVFFALSVTALVVPYLKNGVPVWLTCALGWIGIAYWYFTGLNFQHRLDIRWKRIHEIEHILGYDAHLRLLKERQKCCRPRHKHWRCIIFGIYTPLTITVFFHHTFFFK